MGIEIRNEGGNLVDVVYLEDPRIEFCRHFNGLGVGLVASLADDQPESRATALASSTRAAE